MLSLLLRAAVAVSIAATAAGAAQPADDYVQASKHGEFLSRYYPEGAAKRGEQGKVTFRLTINPDGSIGRCEAVPRAADFKWLDGSKTATSWSGSPGLGPSATKVAGGPRQAAGLHRLEAASGNHSVGRRDRRHHAAAGAADLQARTENGLADRENETVPDANRMAPARAAVEKTRSTAFKAGVIAVGQTHAFPMCPNLGRAC